MPPFEVGIVIAAESCVPGDVRAWRCPNIIGSATFYGTEAIENFTGALYASTFGNHDYGGHTAGDVYWPNLHISASRSSLVYGSSQTVQPPAFQILMMIKV